MVALYYLSEKTGKLWMCIDFRALNANIKLYVLPLPRISDLLNRLGKAKYFSSIQLATAYH